ncbi:hypothetical protein [Maribacter sp. 2307UL18-2]|uniref:hypothetical protein n=1 Tax=Maribacter sp. 2307UL18-2 TaxID=3386274 RepID=UPI0039BC9AA6
MIRELVIALALTVLASKGIAQETSVDTAKHEGLQQLEFESTFKVLHSTGEAAHAQEEAALVNEAYQFLTAIMGEKSDFCLLVLSEKDWATHAYLPVPGMPEYYKGNLIVGAGKNSMADGYEQMLGGFPPEMTTELKAVYTNAEGEFDMQLFFDKLSIHELTHSFQDPNNSGGFSMSRWLEEVHANMGLYAFYKYQRPKELIYITSLVDFSLNNPPPQQQYNSLSDFNTHYYELSPGDYGFYQMKFTRAAQRIIDTLGVEVLKPLNDFLIKYDESWSDQLDEAAFQKRLATEVDPFIIEAMEAF